MKRLPAGGMMPFPSTIFSKSSSEFLNCTAEGAQHLFVT